MRTPDIFLVLGARAGQTGPEASCRHELGRCGGHKPGDGSCGAAAPAATKAEAPTPTPLADVQLAPGEFAEINLEMAADSTIEVRFDATGGALAWNVHSHDGDRVAIHAEGAGATGTLRFAAPGAGPYSCMWKNSGGAPVRLTARLTAHGEVRVQSVHPAP